VPTSTSFYLKLTKNFPIVTEVHSEGAMTPFGRQLRAFRQDYGLAQGIFAKLTGFRQSYISAIERGGKLADLKTNR